MVEIRTVEVVGTVMHWGPYVVVVPSGPPTPTRPSRVEAQRQQSRAEHPGTPTAEASCVPSAGPTLDDVLGHFTSVVVLLGDDLPPADQRVAVRGALTDRSLRVKSWAPEPASTSSWAPANVAGTSLETAEAVLDRVPEQWPLISVGLSATSNGRSAAVLEVDQLRPEIQTWLSAQPDGSVRLIPFIAEVQV